VRLFFILPFLIFTGLSARSHGQSYSGYVVDSLSLSPLAAVHIRIKHSLRGTLTASNGFFTLTAQRTDTLLLSLTGYSTIELPLFFEDNVLFIRLPEKVTMLEEVRITGTRLTDEKRPPRYVPRPLPQITALSSPFEYFSRYQRERRALIQLIKENDRTYVYNRVINDEQVKEELLREFRISEKTFYELLAQFNRTHRHVQYYTREEEILEELKNFLSNYIR
jgi:hypothetical protein